MNILGIIPARGGSKAIPRKNLLTLGGKTLLQLAIESAQESKMLTRTVVSTDDPEIEQAAVEAGSKVLRRPAELATDTAGAWNVARHVVAQLAAEEGWHTDVVVLLQPTTPFRKGSHIDATVRVLLDTSSDSAMTVREVDGGAFWMLKMSENAQLSYLIEGEQVYTRRQDMPPVYQPAGMVYAISTEALSDVQMLPERDTRGVPVSVEDGLDIDEMWQYKLAQLIWDSRNE
jgi:CMP-N-acetylneuraminic acid synthetase